MFKLKSLLTEGRSERISESQFRDLLNTKASGYTPEDGNIYRGLDGFGYDFGRIDPRDFETRGSAYASTNYYTLIINNSDPWKKYPKRELSCTTSSTKASTYGDVYMVIPYNGTKWGVCSHKDIWYSFDYLKRKVAFDSLNKFFSFIKRVIKYYVRSTPDEREFEDFKRHLKLLGKELDKLGFFEKDEDFVLKDQWEHFWNPYKNSEFFRYNDLAGFVIHLMDPEKNGFDLQDPWRGAPDNREVWTDGPCLLLRYGYYKENHWDFNF